MAELQVQEMDNIKDDIEYALQDLEHHLDIINQQLNVFVSVLKGKQTQAIQSDAANEVLLQQLRKYEGDSASKKVEIFSVTQMVFYLLRETKNISEDVLEFFRSSKSASNLKCFYDESPSIDDDEITETQP